MKLSSSSHLANVSKDFIWRQIAYLDPENECFLFLRRNKPGNKTKKWSAPPDFAIFSGIAILLSTLMLLTILPLVRTGP